MRGCSCHKQILRLAKMFKLALVALLCAQAFARPQEGGIESRVIRGTKAKEGEYPFMASLMQYPDFLYCGACLISDRYVLTAAHCIDDFYPWRIGVGAVNISQQQLLEVDNVTMHPDYDRFNQTYDIALVRLKTPVKLGGNIQTINFPVTENVEGKNLTILGWGTNVPQADPFDVLLSLKRTVISNKECAQNHTTTYPILDNQICTKTTSRSAISHDDSGGPLVHKAADGKNYVVGIVSWGIPWTGGYPDVFTRVSSFVQWIKQNMK